MSINTTALQALVGEAISLAAYPKVFAYSASKADLTRVEGGLNAMIRAIAFTVGGVAHVGYDRVAADAWSSLFYGIQASIVSAAERYGTTTYDCSADPYVTGIAITEILAIAEPITSARVDIAVDAS